MAMKSTLGAPLTEAEEARIFAAYSNIWKIACQRLHSGEATDYYDFGERMIGAGFELRQAVQDAWREANHRQIRNIGLAMRAAANPLKPKPAPKDGDAILKELGL